MESEACPEPIGGGEAAAIKVAAAAAVGALAAPARIQSPGCQIAGARPLAVVRANTSLGLSRACSIS